MDRSSPISAYECTSTGVSCEPRISTDNASLDSMGYSPYTSIIGHREVHSYDYEHEGDTDEEEFSHRLLFYECGLYFSSYHRHIFVSFFVGFCGIHIA